MNDFWFVLLMAVVFFAGTKWFFDGLSPVTGPAPQYGIPVSMSPFPSQQSLQVDSLKIVTPPPDTPTIALTSCDVPTEVERSLSGLTALIKQKYGLVLGGDALSIDKARLTYETMCLAFESPTYQKNLNSLQHPISVNFITKDICFSYTYANPNHTDLWEPCTTLVDEYVLIHELTHQMQIGSSLGRNAHWSAWQAVWKTEKNHRIPTGPCVYEDPGDGGECEADAIAEYMFYKVYRNAWPGGPPGGKTFVDYPTAWPKWYGFVKTQIFGNIEY